MILDLLIVLYHEHFGGKKAREALRLIPCETSAFVPIESPSAARSSSPRIEKARSSPPQEEECSLNSE